MEKKTITYGDLKNRKQKMRDENLVVVNMEEYIQTINAIKDAEAVLLWSITHNEAYGELPEQAKKKKCRTGAIVCFVIAGIAAVILVVSLFGCQTFKGAMGDSAWLLQKGADNIQTQEK